MTTTATTTDDLQTHDRPPTTDQPPTHDQHDQHQHDQLTTAKACELHIRDQQRRWLLEHLWLDGAVGILGGEPKCGKSFLALELATAVASATPALATFAVTDPGPVLLFAAEDDLRDVRERLDSLCQARSMALEQLDLHVITESALRLDTRRDHLRLARTVARIRPRLLVLDPLVRLHRADENSAAEIAPILDFLRRLARARQTAVLLVHHARKGAAHLRAGQALRGSSELHAWGDSYLYLRRKRDDITLSVEHRAAAAIDDIHLALLPCPPAAVLTIRQPGPDSTNPHTFGDERPSAEQRVLEVLRLAHSPMSNRHIRDACRMRTATLCQTLDRLCENDIIRRCDDGYSLIK